MNNEARDADFSALADEPAEDAEKNGDSNAEGAAAEASVAVDPEYRDHEIQRLQGEVAANHDRYLRALADLENFRKRALKERSELLKYQGQSVLFDLLEVYDNLELAVQHSDSELEQLREGLALIHKRFGEILSKWEVRPDPAVGKSFNPEYHNAISRVHVDDAEPGTVLNELKRAFFYKDRLLRAAEVVVAAAPAEEPPEQPEESEETERTDVDAAAEDEIEVEYLANEELESGSEAIDESLEGEELESVEDDNEGNERD